MVHIPCKKKCVVTRTLRDCAQMRRITYRTRKLRSARILTYVVRTSACTVHTYVYVRLTRKRVLRNTHKTAAIMLWVRACMTSACTVHTYVYGFQLTRKRVLRNTHKTAAIMLWVRACMTSACTVHTYVYVRLSINPEARITQHPQDNLNTYELHLYTYCFVLFLFFFKLFSVL